MIRKSNGKDISEEEWNNVLNPFYDNYTDFMESYVLPEVIAFYIASSFYRNAMWDSSFKQHYNSGKEYLNIFSENYRKVKSEVIKLLRVKYSLEITNENPLELKKIEYEI